MFSTTCLQNQIYLPLTHVLSTLTSVRPSNTRPVASVVIGKRQETTSCGHVDASDNFNCIVCVDSLDCAARNFTEFDLSRLSSAALRSSYLDCADAKSNSRTTATMTTTTSSSWRVSHVSAQSFFENKHGFSMEVFNVPPSTPQHPQNYLLNDCLLVGNKRGTSSGRSIWGHTTVRRFKTETLGGSVGGINSQTLRQDHSSRGFFERIFSFRSRRERKDAKSSKASLAAEAGDSSEKLKAILADSSLAPEEQQKIKVAFAEGYLASDGRGRPSTQVRALTILRDLLGIAVIVVILVTFMGGTFRLQIGNKNFVSPEEINVTFDDVQGVAEAKQELREIVEFLKNPDKFSMLGGKLPKGVLLVGPPGTGKTLLARAVAGEAGVPFFHTAGPEFDEILVGQGARRVRDLFRTAKARAPCVIFIDEIDSVGAKRTSSVLHPYASQTINQLLSEMDGFRQNEGVIVLGATNRREDLDKALLRPGRFDVEVQVPIPDLVSRKEILAFYLSKIKIFSDVDVDVLARGTTGFTGADIENLVNQAAIRAAIDKANSVSMKYLENARDKVLMGPERKSRIPDEEANLITAYHEGGHAIVAYFTKHSHPLHKVTIIPRGPSLGHTAYIPEKERYHVSKVQMLAMMDTLMGGRAAEEIVFGSEKITTGASSDLKQATALATQMVKAWGMSEKVGVRTFEDDANPLIVVNDLGQSTSETIDSEIKRLLTESYERAKAILRNHSNEHKLLAEALLKYETLDANDLKKLFNGSKLTREMPSSN